MGFLGPPIMEKKINNEIEGELGLGLIVVYLGILWV